MSDELFIGMLSGTSRDGVDAVLVNFNQEKMEILHAVCTPYPTAIKTTLDQLLETGAPPSGDVETLLDENLGRFFARTAQNLLRDTGMETRDIRAIGSHGQTVWHDPDSENPITIQLGKPELITRGTNTTVVADFRSADLQAGGQGAPLAPLLHQKLFQSSTENRVVLNLGGIANISLLPAAGGVSGFDCGPGNCLMDLWTQRHLQKDYDNNGKWASRGAIDKGLLARLLDDPYFRLPPPKSTGLEYFNALWLDDKLGLDDKLADSAIEPADVQCTLAELTAVSIANDLGESIEPNRLLVCGGGAHNRYLMRRIAAALPDVIVESTSRYGVDPDWVEGLLFAWLARERLNGSAQNTTPITGAGHSVLLGSIHKP
jgi:anhydro-N-acetylmuramic acid kinase